ncbi:MAG: hypothetical protein ACOZFS_06940 [Thermodesulfobacteriota bacterium]
MGRLYLYVLMLVGGLLVLGATGDLVSAGRYDLLFGPAEFTKSVFSLGDMVDSKMALQSALAREFGVTNTAEAIRLLSDRYSAAHPVTISTPDLNINAPLNSNMPLNGVVAGRQAVADFYPQLLKELGLGGFGNN